MSEQVIALDPGERTGWATAIMDLDYFQFVGTGVLAQDHMARSLAEWQAIRFLNKPWRVALDENHTPIRTFDVIVAESWRPRRDANGRLDWIEGDPLLSAQHLGQIRFIADLSGATYREFSPMQKPFWVASMPAKLKSLDAHSNEQHDKDARMHLWGYFFENWFSGEGDPEEYVYV